jgi:hypothetical protein
MPFLLVVLLLPLIAVLFYAFVCFDRLVRAQYAQHRSSWEADGRPAGFFWRTKECTFLGSNMARIRLSFAWLFRTPAWVLGSSELLRTLTRHRIAALVWNAGLLIWFVVFLFTLRGG